MSSDHRRDPNNDARPESPQNVVILSPAEIEKILCAHEEWIATDGRKGKQARLVGASLESASLTNANLQNADLANAKLEGADLRGAQLQNSTLKGAYLENAQLQGANLQDAQLQDATLMETNLNGADLQRAQLQRAYMAKAQFEGANLTGAQLKGAEMAECQLRGAVLNRAILKYAQMAGADLREAALEESDLTFADLKDALLTNAEIQYADMERVALVGADLNMAKLGGANLSGARLDYAKLMFADLRETGLNRACLAEADLAQAALQDASLIEANLRGANLSGVRFDRACLDRAELQGAKLNNAHLDGASLDHAVLIADPGHESEGKDAADLSDCSLRDASLQNAQLSEVVGLRSDALGGSILLRAQLPEEIAAFRALETVAEISTRARALFLSAIAACLYSWLTIATTTDAALVTNTASTPLPIIQTQIPIAWFYWVAPGILLALFLYLHLYLQRLWESLASLPAVFPSGRTLYEEAYPWLLSSLVLAFVPKLADRRPTFWVLQITLSALAGWVLVPVTIFGFWARYLPRHDLPGTMAISVALVVSIWGAVAFWRRAVTTLRKGDARNLPRKPFLETLVPYGAAVVLAAVLLAVNHSGHRFDVLVIRSYAELRDEELSLRPSDWWKLSNTERRRHYGVVGAKLSGADLRLADAAGAFLSKAQLDGADLRGADLRGADLYGADLAGADLRGAEVGNAELRGVKRLDCQQLESAVGWQDAFRDQSLACRASIPTPPR